MRNTAIIETGFAYGSIDSIEGMEAIADEIPMQVSLWSEEDLAADEGGEDLSAFQQYWRSSRRARYLSAEQEYSLALAMRDGDPVAKQKLFEANLPWIRWLAVWHARGMTNCAFLEDLIQAANESIWRNIHKYDPKKGRFTTWSWHRALAAVQRADMSESHLIHVPVHVIDGERRVTRLRLQHEAASGDEIAAEMGVSPEQLDRMEAQIAKIPSFISTSAERHDEVSGNYDSTVGDMLADPQSSPGGVLDPLEASHRQEVVRELNRLIRAACTPRERKVLALLFTGGDRETGKDETLDSVGGKLGVSRERVRQLRDSALRHIRQADAAGRLRQLYELCD